MLGKQPEVRTYRNMAVPWQPLSLKQAAFGPCRPLPPFQGDSMPHGPWPRRRPAHRFAVPNCPVVRISRKGVKYVTRNHCVFTSSKHRQPGVRGMHAAILWSIQGVSRDVPDILPVVSVFHPSMGYISFPFKYGQIKHLDAFANMRPQN